MKHKNQLFIFHTLP